MCDEGGAGGACVHFRVPVNQRGVMHSYHGVQDTSMAMITAPWEGRKDRAGVHACRSRVESR